MIGTELYWTIVAGVGGACWAIISSIRERKTQAIRQSHSIIERLVEGDKLVIEHPDIQQYLSKTALGDESSFRDPEILDHQEFFKAKSYLYYKLNLFDEILSTAAQSKRSSFFFRPPEVIEIEDWEAYMVHRLSHPICRTIMKSEGHIFGRALQEFWNNNKVKIENSKPDIYSW